MAVRKATSALAHRALRAFKLIKEPRIVRIFWLAAYISLLVVGVGVIADAIDDTRFVNVIGQGYVYAFAIFMLGGGILGSIAILPGWYYMERAGLIGLAAGVLIYALVSAALGTSLVGLTICWTLLLIFAARWFDIRGPQLAPIVPQE